MATQWETSCVRCGKAEISYADALAAMDKALGKARPFMCQKCIRLENRGMKAVASPQIVLRPSDGNTNAAELPPVYPLGQIRQKSPLHQKKEIQSGFNRKKFGVRDEEIQLLYDEILREDTPVVIAVAPTGSGKSTFLPYRLLEPVGLPKDTFTSGRQIVITQPRRGATIGITGYVSKTLLGADLGVGHEIGYRVRGDHACDQNNRMVYVTDGTLINWIVRGELDRISMVVIDEAHERSLNIDVILGMLANLLPKYPHLKVLIVSATINHAKFKKFFDEKLPGNKRCGIVECSGTKPKDLKVHWRNPEAGQFEYASGPLFEFGKQVWQDLADAIVKLAVQMHQPSQNGPKIEWGDVLGFLHGATPIEDACNRIRTRLKNEHPKIAAKTDVYPLFAAVSEDVRRKAVDDKKDPSRLRIVIASNAAETSLTIDSLVHVVESGFIKQTQWDPALEQAPLRPIAHSQAGCRQRWGRVGRTMDGYTWCLYSREQFHSVFPTDTTPEIQRSCLDGIILLAKRAGADRLDGGQFPWLDAPSEQEIKSSMTRLSNNGWLDEDGDLTAEGVKAAFSGGEDAYYAKLVRDCDRFGFGIEVATLLPFIKKGVRAVFPIDPQWDAAKKQAVIKAQSQLRMDCEDDLDLCLRAYHGWKTAEPKNKKRWTDANGIDLNALVELDNERASLVRELGAKKKELEDREIDFAGLARLRLLMARVFADGIFEVDGDQDSTGSDNRVYRSAGNSTNETELEIGNDSSCKEKKAKAIVALGPKKHVRRTDLNGEEFQRLQALFCVSLDNVEYQQVARMSDLHLADFFREKLPRPTAGSDEAKRIQFHEKLRRRFPIGCQVSCIVTNVSPAEISVEVDDLQISWSVPRLLPTGVRKISEDDKQEESMDFRFASESKGRKQKIQKIEEGFDDQFDEQEFEKIANGSDEFDRVVVGRLGNFDPNQKFKVGDVVKADVVRYSDRGSTPSLNLAYPPANTRFNRFTKKFKVGQTVDCQVLGAAPTGSNFVGLSVRELTTGFDTVIPFEELFPFYEKELLDLIPIGSVIKADILETDRETRQIRLSVMKRLESKINSLEAGKQYPGRVLLIDVAEYSIFVTAILDCSSPANGLIVPVKLVLKKELFEAGGKIRLPYRKGDKISLSLGSSDEINKRMPRSRTPVDDLSTKERNALKTAQIELSNKILTCKKSLSIREWNKLKKIAQTPELITAIREMHYSSLQLWGQRIVSELEQKFRVGSIVKGKVTWASGDGIKVALKDGVEGFVPKSEVSWWRRDPLVKRHAKIGDTVEAKVLRVDASSQTVQLSKKQVIADPWQGGIRQMYPLNKTVECVVCDIKPYGAFVQLEPGLVGMIHITQMKKFNGGFVHNVSDVVSLDEVVHASILSIDLSRKNVDLTLEKATRKKRVEKIETAGNFETENADKGHRLAGWDEDIWPWTDGEAAIKKGNPPAAPPEPAEENQIPLTQRTGPAGWSLSWQ